MCVCVCVCVCVLCMCPLRTDDKTIAEYGIDAGSVLHLVLALRG